MIWVDRAIGEIRERFGEKVSRGEPIRIRDEKTLSGPVHVGSLRGIAIHGLISQALTEQGIPNVFNFELNDVDPVDELPPNLKVTHQQYMGQNLYSVPSHVPGAENYPMVFGNELVGVCANLGFPITFYTLRPEYESGKFNEVIVEALEHAAEIRTIYREVSGSQKPDDWYPLQIVCEKCAKVGTTQVTGWNGKEVSYLCRKDLVKWAEGCGHQGSVSPFNGRAKLPWKVEWPAKWKVFGVDIEGAGKDHSAAGGSRAIGKRIVEEVFHYPNPYDIPYEFFNIGGKKMSASKGLGATAKAISDLLPPTMLKLLLIRKLPNQPIDFDPEGVTIPQLFDEYDRLADHYFKRHKEPDPDLARIFALTQKDFPKPPEDLWQMRFSLVAFLAQMPHLDMKEEAVKIKGSPLSSQEETTLDERHHYVGHWLKGYAPEKYMFKIAVAPPDGLILTSAQTEAMKSLSKGLESCEWTGEAIHGLIHAVKEQSGLQPKKLFSPLYRIFLNRDDGPQMGWFLSTFKREEVIKRLKAMSH